MAMKNELVPLSQANTDRIKSELYLPFKLEEQIGMDTKRVHTLLQLGGLRTLRITVDDKRKASEIQQPQVIGINSDGSAIAGNGQTKKSPLFISKTDGINEGSLTKQARWRDVQVKFNIEELKQQILGDGGNARDPGRWGREIDHGIRSSLVETGENNLLDFGFDTADGARSITWYTLGGLVTVLGGLSPAIAFAASSITFNLLANSIIGGVEKSGGGARTSLFIGPEIDRALALRAYAFTDSIVKEL